MNAEITGRALISELETQADPAAAAQAILEIAAGQAPAAPSAERQPADRDPTFTG